MGRDLSKITVLDLMRTLFALGVSIRAEQRDGRVIVELSQYGQHLGTTSTQDLKTSLALALSGPMMVEMS